MKATTVMTESERLRFEALSVGDLLPALDVPIDVSNIVAMSIATRDFHPVHHDPAHAGSVGHPTLFINIMSTAGLIERFVRAWAGDAPRLGSLKLKLGVPHYAGDALHLTGRIAALGREEADAWVDIEFKGNNTRGVHASGQLRLIWP